MKNRTERARELRRNQTRAEKILWGLLRNRKLDGKKFRRQQPIDGSFVDFYCHECKLVIEIDGPVHFTNENQERDVSRDENLSNQELRVVRIRDEDVLKDQEHVLKILKGIIAEQSNDAVSELKKQEHKQQ